MREKKRKERKIEKKRKKNEKNVTSNTISSRMMSCCHVVGPLSVVRHLYSVASASQGVFGTSVCVKVLRRSQLVSI